MPSREHELSIEMLSRKPALLARLMRKKKLGLPKCVLVAEPESVRWQSTRMADLVFVGRVDGVPVLACVAEVQRSWSDFNGFIGVAPLALDGSATGTPFELGVGWDDNAHAIIGLAGGFLLAANTTPGGNPAVIASVGCR